MEGDPSLGEEPQKPDPGVLVGDKILQINKFFNFGFDIYKIVIKYYSTSITLVSSFQLHEQKMLELLIRRRGVTA